MADNRKKQERDELHRTIWGIANDLRGSVDGWDFKQYVLGMLFYRYISENFANYINDGEREAGDATFDYAQLSDSDAEQARDDLIKTKGFFILPSQLFCSVRSRAPLDENLNETLEAVFQAIEDSAKGSDSEANFSGLFDDIDVNSNKLGGTVFVRAHFCSLISLSLFSGGQMSVFELDRSFCVCKRSRSRRFRSASVEDFPTRS